VPLGALALEELKRRRPDVRVVLFGSTDPYPLSFEHEHLGVVGPAVLARHYSAATAGLCLSLTNWSLVPQEMLACGLPCVDLAGGSTEVEAGDSGSMSFAEPDPSALASALEGLLDDEQAWEERSRAGIRFARSASWELAASEVEHGLREALREREGVGPTSPLP
jgi:glycosyltransferase involved in cell wall biosynthesis